MNILWFTWKDRRHPTAGGAEVLNEEHAKRLVKNGYKVTFIVAGFANGKRSEMVDGYRVIRVGNRWTVYWEAYKYFKRHLQNWPDYVIEEINTFPFFTQFYVKQPKALYIYQLCREIWFHELFFPLSLIGYFLEPIYLFLLRGNIVFTESESTKKDLQRYGYSSKKIHIIPIGITLKPIEKITDAKKYKEFTILSFGAIRSMKQTMHQLEAFELAKVTAPSLKLKIAGPLIGAYGKKFLQKIKHGRYIKDIEYLGPATEQKKKELMQKCHVILVTSIKEGWGLVVTEAASQGTPAIVYNSDGLRDSVIHLKTGLICRKNTPENLAKDINNFFKNKQLYKKTQLKAVSLSRKFSSHYSHAALLRVIKI